MDTTVEFSTDDMRELLELAMRIDAGANRTYESLATRCAHAELADIFRRMAADESAHLEWWTDLKGSFEKGLVPAIGAASSDLIERMRSIAAELDTGSALELACDDSDGMLEAATQLEFFMLDPVFGELIELTESDGGSRHLTAYGHHIERLAGAIEQYYRKNQLAAFLAGVLRRSWRDFVRAATLNRYDPLTHVLNRRGLFLALDQWASWSARYDRPLAVVTMDLDHFKRINDEHGHAAGDLALVAFATALHETVRDADLIGRQGGDEFAIVAPETDAEALDRLLARIVAEVSVRAQSNWPYQRTTPLRLSAGGAWTAGGSRVSGEQLMAAADGALYRAKEAGRNQAATAGRIDGDAD